MPEKKALNQFQHTAEEVTRIYTEQFNAMMNVINDCRAAVKKASGITDEQMRIMAMTNTQLFTDKLTIKFVVSPNTICPGKKAKVDIIVPVFYWAETPEFKPEDFVQTQIVDMSTGELIYVPKGDLLDSIVDTIKTHLKMVEELKKQAEAEKAAETDTIQEGELSDQMEVEKA